MREIKFKAQRVGDREWVYGSYTQMREEDHNECFRTKPHKTYHRIWQWEAGDWNMGGYANYEVISETIGQFTGLKDKNGVEIYEGDIIEFVTFFIKDTVVEKVWIDEHGCLHPFFDPFYIDDEQGAGMSDETIKVIGNIHDKHKQQ